MSRLLFKWTEDALIAANTGRRFTRSGLEALCSSHMTEEEDERAKPFSSEDEARQFVERIRNQRLAAYSLIPDDVVSHARIETETGRDYSNRLLLELMQNADDAAAKEAIGYKGLGFKSVLDVAESAYIYSGFLRVAFDRGRSRSALQSITNSTELPVLRLPFWNDANNDAEVVELLKQYDTVIVLPWRNGVVPTPFESEWKSVRNDISVLLLLHALEEVVWEGPQDEHIEWKCPRESKTELSVTASASVTGIGRWRIFREHKTSAVVVPVDDHGQPRPYRHEKLRVFFPTEETSPLPMILHGEFDLEQNRKHVRPGGTRETIVHSLARCVKLALDEVTNDGQFLDLLQPRIPPENMAGLEREIWDAVSAVVREMTLPQSRVKLREVRLCPQANIDGLPWDWQRLRLDNWKAFKELLGKHRPGGLAGLNVLLPETDTDEREKTVCAFNPNAHLLIEELQRIPLFPVAGQDAPVAVAGCSLFYPPEKNELTVDAVPGVPIAFLRGEFAVACREQKSVYQFLEKLGVAEFSPAAIAVALAKSDLAAVPHESLWQFLVSTVGPMLAEEHAVMDWKDKSRQFLAKHVKVPCRNDEWQVAVNVYAGQDWTNDNFLERAYGSNRQRYFLTAPPTDEKRRQHFERLARWLGVGWSPKVLPIVNFEDKSGTKDGPQWCNGEFPLNAPRPLLWREHCKELDDGENAKRKARLRQDWTIDGDERVLKIAGAFACIAGEWKSYKEYLQSVVYRSSNRQHDNDNESRHGFSYLLHLLKHVAWIPRMQDGQPEAAQNVFVKECEVQRELQGWVFSPTAEVKPDVAKGIGIRREWSEVTKADWQRWLKRSLELKPQGNPSDKKMIAALYQQALCHFGERHDERNQRLWCGEIWCIEKRPDNTEVWHRAAADSKVYYVDRPDLACLRLEMVRTFPVELGRNSNKEKAKQLFGIQPLSEHLRGKPRFDREETSELADKIVERLRERTKSLAAYLKVKELGSVAACEKWKKLQFRAGRDLQVAFSLNGETQSPQKLPAFFQIAPEQTAPTLWLDAAENFTDNGQPKDDIAWEEVGKALCYAAGLSLEHGTVFTGLLGCGEDSLKRKLLNLGVTEADIAAVIPSEVSKAEPQPPSSYPQTHSSTPPDGTTPTREGIGEMGGHRGAGVATGAGGHSGGGGGGESEQHRQLKERLAQQPELIEDGLHATLTEYEFKSGDRADLVCEDSSGVPVAIEVETDFRSGDGRMIGVWQAVKYKHLLAVEKNRACSQVRAFLVAPAMPDDVQQECERCGVEPKVISDDA